MNKIKLTLFALYDLCANPSFADIDRRLVTVNRSAVVITPNMMLWISPSTGKLRFTLVHQPGSAALQIRDYGKGRYHTSLNSPQSPVTQQLDLLNREAGRYVLAITVDRKTVLRTLTIAGTATKRTGELT